MWICRSGGNSVSVSRTILTICDTRTKSGCWLETLTWAKPGLQRMPAARRLFSFVRVLDFISQNVNLFPPKFQPVVTTNPVSPLAVVVSSHYWQFVCSSPSNPSVSSLNLLWNHSTHAHLPHYMSPTAFRSQFARRCLYPVGAILLLFPLALT